MRSGDTDKNSLRIWAKNERKRLNTELASRNLSKKLLETEEYKNSKNIMLFYPLKYEVNLLSILDDGGKNFYLPKIDGKNLLCCPYSKGDKLCLSCFKTEEPFTEPADTGSIDLIIIPALCCDKSNYRLGYGGGFYDRFLADKDVLKLVCIQKELIVETIYPDSYDIQADIVLTS